MTYLTEDFTAKIKEFDSPQAIMNWLEFNIPAFTTAQKAPKATDKLLRPQQVLQRRCGNSFQQSVLARQALQNLHYPCHVFCAKENCISEDWGRTGHSHIFVVYQDAGEYFWLEHALGYLRGIKAFATLQHVFAYMAEWWLRNNQLGASADILEFRELPVAEYGPTVLDLAQQVYQLPICFTASIADNPHYPVQPAHLNQDTRTQLVAASKDRGDYKNTTRGKNRFQRKKYSKVGNAVKQYNSIDMNTLFKQDVLLIKIPVTGETASYQVSLKLQGVMDEVARNIKNNQNKLEYRTIVQALTKVFNTKNVYINCTCDDYCLHPDTKIKLLDGTTVTVEDLQKKVKTSAEPVYVYSVDENGDFKPGKVKDVWVSGSTNEMLKITLDNGNSIITTPEHPYMLRTGQYKEAKDLQVGTSLMPLYFGTTKNGYQTVKANSKATTEFYSTYKQVANALLQKEIEEARERSGENVIAIHHKDFNKSNNSPENLLPMGVQEHYKYHYEHVFDSGAFDKFKAAGEEHRKLVMDHNTPEYQKQAAVMSRAIQDYWASLTDEEKLVDSDRKRTVTKAAWESGCYDTAKRKAADAARKEFLHTPEMEAKSAEGVRNYWANLSDEEREKVILQRKQNLSKGTGWNKGKHLSAEDRFKKSQAALARPQQLKDLQARKTLETKMLKVFNKMLEDNTDLTAENYEKYRSLYFSNSPKLSVLFNNIAEAANHFKLNHKIIKIETISYDFLQPVYDIEVEKYHNFYVDAGVILHNCYRFKHWSIVHKYSTQDSAKDPGPGKGIANPHDDKGRGCKHCLLVLSNLQWIMKVSSVINNYIHYTEEKLPKPFLNLIFPKLYGIPAEQMVQQNLIDDEKFLQTSKGLIDAINQYGKNRGKIKKGSNINPVKANQLQQQQKAAKNAEQKTT